MKIIQLLVLLSFGLFSCNQAKKQNNQELEKDLHLVASKLCNHLLNAPKYMMYETDFLHAVHYAEVCAAYGALKYERHTDNQKLIVDLMSRYEPLESDSSTWQNHHVDGNVYGILPFQLFQKTGDSTFLEHGLFMADSQWKNPSPNGLTAQARYWIDDVFMVACLQVEAYKATHEQKYLDRAARITSSFIDSLQQENGLFFHGPDAPIHWGRGNGWMAVGMAITLTELPENHADYQLISSGFVKMMENLLLYQSENGMWKQIVDLEGAWDEPSCTAMFAYAMSVGINKSILKNSKYQSSVISAWNTLQDYVNKKGEVVNVCAGTGQSTDPNYYLDRPRINGDFHGQAPLLWLIDNMLTGIENYQ